MRKFYRILLVGNFTKWVIAPCAIICAFAPESVDAQAAPQAEFNPALVRVPMARFHVTTPDITIAATSPFALNNASPSGKRYVLVGAGVGAATGAILGLVVVSQDKSGYFSSWHFVAAPTLAGAGVGALTGYLVYLAKR